VQVMESHFGQSGEHGEDGDGDVNAHVVPPPTDHVHLRVLLHLLVVLVAPIMFIVAMLTAAVTELFVQMMLVAFPAMATMAAAISGLYVQR